MKKEAWVLLLAVGLDASAARADPMEHSLAQGQQLVDSCRSSASTFRAMCLGYLAAVIDEARLDRLPARPGLSTCLPPFTNLELYREAYMAFVGTNPEVLAMRSFEAVKAALAARFPCQ